MRTEGRSYMGKGTGLDGEGYGVRWGGLRG